MAKSKKTGGGVILIHYRRRDGIYDFSIAVDALSAEKRAQQLREEGMSDVKYHVPE